VVEGGDEGNVDVAGVGGVRRRRGSAGGGREGMCEEEGCVSGEKRRRVSGAFYTGVVKSIIILLF
jgi:hypothetical protein